MAGFNSWPCPICHKYFAAYEPYHYCPPAEAAKNRWNNRVKVLLLKVADQHPELRDEILDLLATKPKP